jgi:hypothetical protein
MFTWRNSVGLALLAITGILLMGAVAVWTRSAFAATTSGGKTGGTEYAAEAGMKAVPDQDKALEGRKALPGHGGFCPLKGKQVVHNMGMGRGRVGMPPPLPGHGGFLGQGQEC